MHVYVKSACWAAVILGTAVAGEVGLVDQDATTTLLIALPVAAWMAISGRGCCLSDRRA
ncbi:MAG TPA: hypothetical protein VKY80_10295 [Croceibacterium sp.]|nr:hypothetical protein [Croceibacterium sp.]